MCRESNLLYECPPVSWGIDSYKVCSNGSNALTVYRDDDKMKTKILERIQKMSLVIGMRSQHGIVICADSRLSAFQNFGVTSKVKDAAQKVFQNEHMIVGACGLSSIILDEDYFYLQKLFESAIRKTNNPNDFCSYIHEKVNRQLTEMENDTISLLFGTREVGSDIPYTLWDAYISKESCNITRYNKDALRFMGASDLLPRKLIIHENYSVKKMVYIGNTIIQQTIELGNALIGEKYNPVGGTVKSVSLQQTESSVL